MGQITGIVKLIDTPVSGKTVHLYYRDTGVLYGSTTSAGDGTFSFTGIPEEIKFTAVALSDNANYNDAIDDGLSAEYLLFTEIFTDNLTSYSLITGSLTPFSTTSPSIITTGTSSANNNSSIRRNITYCYINKLEFEFKITALNNDDAVVLYTWNSNSNAYTITFNPARESAYDPSRRPRIYIHGVEYLIHTTTLLVNVNYKLSAIFPVSGNSSITLTNLDTMTIISNTSATSSVRPRANRLGFYIDWAASGVLSTTNYSTIKIYYEL